MKSCWRWHKRRICESVFWTWVEKCHILQQNYQRTIYLYFVLRFWWTYETFLSKSWIKPYSNYLWMDEVNILVISSDFIIETVTEYNICYTLKIFLNYTVSEKCIMILHDVLKIKCELLITHKIVCLKTIYHTFHNNYLGAFE